MDVTLTLLGIVLYLSRDDCHHTVSAGTEHPTIRIFAVPKHRNLSLSLIIVIKADKTSSQDRPKTKAARFCFKRTRH
jgi:hypothetical protein